MSIAYGLVKGRSHIVFMLGLIAAGAMIIGLERSSLLNAPAPAPLTGARLEAATLGWHAAAGLPDATRLAAGLGVDTGAPRPAGPPSMSPAAGRAILVALANPLPSDTTAVAH